MVRLSITIWGNVPQSVIDNIVGIIQESYEKMGRPMSEPVNVELYEAKPDAIFFATHSIREGKSWISVFMDKFLDLPQPVAIGGLRRQVAHSILHGSIDFYLLPLPQELLEGVLRYKLSWSYAHSLLYAIAMTAKEYEVTEFLYRKGFIADQVAYAQYILEPSSEELFYWEVASKNREERVLYLLSLLRDVAPFIPFGAEVRELIERKLALLPPKYQSKIKGIIHRLPLLGVDTKGNIGLLSRIVVEEILREEFETGR